MGDNRGAAKLIARGDMLCVQFEPPLSHVADFDDPQAGHPVADVVRNNEGVRWIIYERGVFGWRDIEREADFVDYCKKQAESIGYEVVNGLLATSESSPVADEA